MDKFASLSEKLSSLNNEAIDFSEDFDFENSAALTDKFDGDYKEEVPIRSSLRDKNSKLLSELDERYKGSKISRKEFEDNSEELDKESDEETEEEGSEEDDNTDEAEGVENNINSDSTDNELDLEDSDEEGNEDEISKFKEALGKFGTDNGRDSEGSEDEDSFDEEDEDEISKFKEALGKFGIDNGRDSEGNEDEDSFDEEDEEETKGISESDKKEEIDKGKATQDQLRIWDSLLEIRIALQKLLLEANKLPQPDTFEIIKNASLEEIKDDETKMENVITNATNEIKKLIRNMLDLQDMLVQQNSETNDLVSGDSKGDTKEEPQDEEIVSSESEKEEKEESENEEEIGKCKRKKRKIVDFDHCEKKEFEKLLPFRNQTIEKWNDKTQVGTGGGMKKNFSAFKTSTMKQIEQVLLDKERLTKRTQTKRSNYEIIGAHLTQKDPSEDSVQDPEIFDDDDFYHQLLRELIERKTSGVTDSYQLSHHWLELQKLRSKMKRKIDTRASKGRKIRYEVIPKLVNYMAPVVKSSLSEPAFKELLNSLFGKAAHFQL